MILYGHAKKENFPEQLIFSILPLSLKNVTNMLIEAYETKNTGIIDSIYHMHTDMIQLDSNIISTLTEVTDILIFFPLIFPSCTVPYIFEISAGIFSSSPWI